MYAGAWCTGKILAEKKVVQLMLRLNFRWKNNLSQRNQTTIIDTDNRELRKPKRMNRTIAKASEMKRTESKEDCNNSKTNDRQCQPFTKCETTVNFFLSVPTNCNSDSER